MLGVVRWDGPELRGWQLRAGTAADQTWGFSEKKTGVEIPLPWMDPKWVCGPERGWVGHSKLWSHRNFPAKGTCRPRSNGPSSVSGRERLKQENKDGLWASQLDGRGLEWRRCMLITQNSSRGWNALRRGSGGVLLGCILHLVPSLFINQHDPQAKLLVARSKN